MTGPVGIVITIIGALTLLQLYTCGKTTQLSETL
ncbi:hypothetical protein CoNPh26_CDS0143 [Staphylococcus phage S-CoN_Ph26]|nr:hypothetical protein CoNPh26_CDS0143 [Staphylococcus phage S-CoN_Ph26]